MNNKDDFQPLFLEGISLKQGTDTGRKSVVKKNNVKMNSPMKIYTEKEDIEESIEPILEDDEIVGVIHTCSCGKTTAIRFEYDEERDSNSEINNS